jgi:hypothetical protein
MEEEIKAPTQRKQRDKSTYALSGKSKDPDKEEKKAELFQRLTALHMKQGVAKFETVDEMRLLIEQYFTDCAEFKLRPTVRGLALALGTVYETLNGWERGERDSTLGNQTSVIIKKAKQLIAEYDEIMAVEGYDNPILFMFRAKNYYGMQDKQEITFNPTNTNNDAVPLDDIKKLLNDQHDASYVVDADAKEV